jgi:hypothetical protein
MVISLIKRRDKMRHDKQTRQALLPAAGICNMTEDEQLRKLERKRREQLFRLFWFAQILNQAGT